MVVKPLALDANALADEYPGSGSLKTTLPLWGWLWGCGPAREPPMATMAVHVFGKFDSPGNSLYLSARPRVP